MMEPIMLIILLDDSDWSDDEDEDNDVENGG